MAIAYRAVYLFVGMFADVIVSLLATVERRESIRQSARATAVARKVGIGHASVHRILRAIA